MANDATKHDPRHLRMTEPSAWVLRFLPLIPAGGRALDVAAGGGRHVQALRAAGHAVTAVDRNIEPLGAFAADPEVELVEADLEDGSPWPLAGRTFAAVLVCNYLYRPLFPALIEALEPRGLLIYETFARGNEAFAKPRNPDHLLRAGELLEAVRGRLQIVAYQHGRIATDECPGVKQMIVAVNDLGRSARDDGEPEAHPLGDGAP